MIKEILFGLGTTFMLSIACFVTGSLIGILTCVGFCSKNKAVKAATKIYNGVVIKIPPLVMLMLFALLLTGNKGQGSLMIAYIGLSLFVAANLAGVFFGGFCSVSQGETDAARTLGLSKGQTFLHIALPQIIQNIAPVYMSMFVMCMQITSVASVLGVTELLSVANDLNNVWMSMVISIAGYFLIGTFGEFVIARIGKRKHIKGSLSI